jgi:hypothetical protein
LFLRQTVKTLLFKSSALAVVEAAAAVRLLRLSPQVAVAVVAVEMQSHTIAMQLSLGQLLFQLAQAALLEQVVFQEALLQLMAALVEQLHLALVAQFICEGLAAAAVLRACHQDRTLAAAALAVLLVREE